MSEQTIEGTRPSRETIGERSRIHGMRWTKEYRIWTNIKTRCFNERNPGYRWYGARGITICPEWRDDFGKFFADVGKCPGPGMTLDRKENNGNYEPGNVHWVPAKAQQNNRRSNRIVRFRSRDYTLQQLAEEYSIHPGTLKNRLNAGYSVEEAISKRDLRAGRMVRAQQRREWLRINFDERRRA